MGKKHTNDNIIKAAIKEFANNPYHKANTNNIALSAGVSKGTVFLHFKNKKQLYLSCIENVYEKNFKAAAEQNFNEIKDFFEKMITISKWKLSYFKEFSDDTMLFYKCYFNCPVEVKEDVNKIFLNFAKMAKNQYFEEPDFSSYCFNPKYTTQDIHKYIQLINLGVEANLRKSAGDNFTKIDMESYYKDWFDMIEIFKNGLQK